MKKLSKSELAALLATISFSTGSVAHAASPLESTGQSKTSSSMFKITERNSLQKLGSESGCGGSGSCGSADKGKEGSCKGKEGSCKGKEGSCKGKEGSCKGKEDNKKDGVKKAKVKKKQAK